MLKALSFIAIVVTIAGIATAQTSRVPRTPEGSPDLAGLWQAFTTAAWDLQDHPAQAGIPAGQGVVVGNEIPYHPWALQKKKENFEKRTTEDPETKCYLPDVPRITYTPFPFQIIQTPKELVILYEYAHAVRSIRADRTPHLEDIEWWLGNSRGHWDGDTLVVDVTNFNDKTWFDRAGNFHSDALHVVERYTLRDADHIDYEAIIEDQGIYTAMEDWPRALPPS